ncbi:MAG: response regulator [bacterium]|nr:response regulator [bacterium]
MKKELGKLLVVDDNEMNRDMLSRRLKRLGHTVEVAVDGKQALEMTATQSFDLILLDIMMPEISGIEVLKKLREKYTIAELPIIMVTAKDQSEDIVEALNLGANDYVTKPIDFPVVNARVQTQLTLKRLAELKDEFLRIASHDLKNPLTGIIGYTSLLNSMLAPIEQVPAELKNSISRVANLAQMMKRIITDFLDFQAMEDGQMKLEPVSFDINDIARMAVINNFDYAKSKEIEMLDEIPSTPIQVHADQYRIQQVIENFVSNAIKFGEKGSKVTVRTRIESEKALVEVSDTGPGLKDEDMQKLFVKYARLSNKPTGGEKSSGLGLAICKKIIELHQGEIGARNNPDKGATFWFALPLPKSPE